MGIRIQGSGGSSGDIASGNDKEVPFYNGAGKSLTNTNLITVDTTNQRIGIGGVTPTATLDVNGDGKLIGLLNRALGNVNNAQATYDAFNGTNSTANSGGFSQTSITSSAKLIWGAFSSFVIVKGNDAGVSNAFMDIIFVGPYPGNVVVVSSGTTKGSPAVRTYAQSASGATVSLASGTYSTNAFGFAL